MKTPKHPPITFRASPEINRQLNALCAIWGENKTDAIKRAISMAWQAYFPTKTAEEVKK